MAQTATRIRLATTWMNEEWYNDRIRRQQDRDWVGSTTLNIMGL